jgi:hypothetical protein
MKKILFVSIISIFISQMGFAQDSLIKFEKIVYLDSIYLKDDLYVKARQWISDNFTDANSVITISDKESGELSGNGSFEVNASKLRLSGVTQIVRFKIAILVKNAKYKVQFYNFEHTTPSYTELSMGLITNSVHYPYKTITKMAFKTFDKVWIDTKNQLNVKVESLFSSLEKAMREKPKNEGW